MLLNTVTIAVGQDAASLASKVAQADTQAAITEGLRVHLVPAEPDQANNVLRYSETPVNRDATFAFTNICARSLLHRLTHQARDNGRAPERGRLGRGVSSQTPN
jgi:hypothetical protein